MLLNKRAAPKRPAGPDRAGAPSLYEQLKKEIPAVRAQGAQPDRDSGSFSRYACDLCHTAHPIENLRQCGLCGRWACPACRNDEYYICNSCNGIRRLLTPGTGR